MPDSDPAFTPTAFTAPTNTVDVKLTGHSLGSLVDQTDNWKSLFGDDSISHTFTSTEGHLDLSKIDLGTPDYHTPSPDLNDDIDFARKFNVDGVSGSADFVKVDPNQIKAWADTIESELLPYVDSMQSKLSNQNLYIGGLPEAQNTQADIAKLKDQYGTILQNSKSGLQKLVQDLRSAAKTYDSTAELTKDKAQYVSKLVKDMGQFTTGGTGTGAPTLNNPASTTTTSTTGTGPGGTSTPGGTTPSNGPSTPSTSDTTKN